MIFQPLKNLLNSGTASIICLILSCLGRMLHLLTSFTFETDRALQLQAAKNLFQGRGISLYQVNPADLGQFEYAPLINWPPLYSVFASPFNLLGEKGFLIGAVTIDLVSCLAFILLARKIYSLLETERWKLNLYTLVIGFSFYSFAQGRSTDLLALVFLLLGCLATLKSLKKNEFSYTNLFLIIFFLWLSGFTRYLSIPISFCIPMLLFLYGHHQRNDSFKKPALIITAGLILFFGLQYFLQMSIGGSGLYLYPSEKGFYPEQWLHTGPLLFAATGNLEPLALLSERHLGISLLKIQQVFIYLNLLLLCVLIPYAVLRLFQRKMCEGMIPPLQILTLLFTLFTLAVLGFLSATQKAQLNWTYVSELRYYAAPIFFIQLCLFHFIFKSGSNGNFRFLRFFAGALMLGSALHGFIFTTKTLLVSRADLDPERSLVNFERNVELFTNLDSTLTQPLIILSNEPAFTSYTAIRNGTPGSFKMLDTVATTKPVTALIAFRKNFGPGILKHLSIDEKEKISENENWVIYKKEISPAQ